MKEVNKYLRELRAPSYVEDFQSTSNFEEDIWKTLESFRDWKAGRFWNQFEKWRSRIGGVQSQC